MKLCECGCGQRVLALVRYGHVRCGSSTAIRAARRSGGGLAGGDGRVPGPREAGGQLTYEAAWKLAVKENPPRSRDMGEMAPTLFGTEMPLVEFLHEAAWAAWHDFTSSEPGQGKALGRFRVDMLASWGDSSEPAARMARAA
jgi:hypothetical protein